MSNPLLTSLPQGGARETAPAGRPMHDVLRSDEVCRDLLERARWPDGPVCTRCGAQGKASRIATRPGLWTCRACRRSQYSVTSGTPLHRTRLPVAHWVRLFNMVEVGGLSPTISQVSRRFCVAHLTAENMLKRLDELKSEMPQMSARLDRFLREIQRGGASAAPHAGGGQNAV
ncbi:MAG TPA: hypothetical protein DCF73_05150 [Rhodobiaceae bacterium]|nr:hypothetical protein [Rhodobiaceae bacterium]